VFSIDALDRQAPPLSTASRRPTGRLRGRGREGPMNRLILLRHGKAERGAPSGEDFDRDLAGRGAREAASTAMALQSQGFVPDVALVSSSARTRQTWAAAASAFPGTEVRFDERLYHAEASLIRRVADEAR